jgi:hypothetical protein
MNNYNKYLNDMDIINEPMPMREIHAIRIMLYEQTKNMTPTEHAEYFNTAAQEIIDNYGLQVKYRTPQKLEHLTLEML